jgi:hypothetical protein
LARSAGVIGGSAAGATDGVGFGLVGRTAGTELVGADIPVIVGRGPATQILVVLIVTNVANYSRFNNNESVIDSPNCAQPMRRTATATPFLDRNPLFS